MSSEHGPSFPDSQSYDFSGKEKLSLPFLSPDAIDLLRKRQYKLVNKAQKDIAPLDKTARDKAANDAYAQFDDLIDAYLESFGIDKNDPGWDEYKNTLRSYSLNNMNDHDWTVGHYEATGVTLPDGTDETELVSGWERANKNYDQKLENVYAEFKAAKPPVPASPEDNPDKDKDKSENPTEKERKERQERIAVLEKELGDVQTAKHKAFAARMAVSVFKSSKKEDLQKEYDEAQRAYLEILEELESLRAAELLKDTRGNGEVNSELEGRFSQYLKDDYEKQREAMLKEGGFKARILEKYANMSTKKKIAVALGAGAILAVSGVGIGLLGGVAGGVLASVGAGGLAGMRAGRTYATVYSRVYAGKPAEQLEFKLADAEATPHTAALTFALDKLRRESEKDIESADKWKRRAVLFSVGSVALGSGVAIAASHVDDMRMGALGDWTSSPEAPATPNPNIAPVDAEHTWSVEPASATKPLEFTPEAYTLRSGAGGYDQLKKMGIPKEHWQELWNKVGPELQEIQNGSGRPLTYEMKGQPGEWGIRMTADGKMPKEALELIANKHQEMFGTNPGLPAGSTAEVIPSASHPIPATIDRPVITAADVQTLKTIVDNPVIEPDLISANPQIFDKLSYVTPGLDGERFAKAMGLPQRVWTENLEPYITSRLEANDPLLRNVFTQSPTGGIELTGNGKITPAVFSDLIEHIPYSVRTSLRVS